MCLDFYLHDPVFVYDLLVSMAENYGISLHGIPLHPSEGAQGDE